MMNNGLEAALRLIGDPLDEERRYSIDSYDKGYEFREKKGLWRLVYNNDIKGQVTSSNGCNSIHRVKTQSGQRTLEEIGLYERKNGGYLVGSREVFQRGDNDKKEKIHPLDYLLRDIVSSETMAGQGPNPIALSEPTYIAK